MTQTSEQLQREGARGSYSVRSHLKSEELVDQLNSLEAYFAQSFRRRPNLPAVGRVVLKEDALAKSHRPLSLLGNSTCPVIGVGRFGDLLVSVRPSGIQQLSMRIRSNTSTNAIAHISTIDRIEPYTDEDVVGSAGFDPLFDLVEAGDGYLKLKIFRHRNASLDGAVVAGLMDELGQANVPEPEQVHYAEGLLIYRVKFSGREQVRAISSFVGAQRLSAFPHYSRVRTQSTPVRSAVAGEFPGPEHGHAYPIVGIIDSGTNESDPIIIWESVDDASRNLAKALLIHSALLNSEKLTTEDLRYRGVGVPPHLGQILECDPWSVTLVFEPDLSQGFEFQKQDFPIPECLRTSSGGVRGLFAMTLVYDPPLDPGSGAEYVRTNVEVSLGTYDVDKKEGKRKQRGQIPRAPTPADLGKLHEKHLIEHGFKWSPVKAYRKLMRNVMGQDWRLLVSVHNRAGLLYEPPPQSMVLLVTMMDPKRQAPVYDETVRAMLQNGWVTHNLAVNQRVRIGSPV